MKRFIAVLIFSFFYLNALNMGGNVEFDESIKPGNSSILLIELDGFMPYMVKVDNSHKAKYIFKYLDKKRYKLKLEPLSTNFICYFNRNKKNSLTLNLKESIYNLDITCKAQYQKSDDNKSIKINIKPGLWQIEGSIYYPNGLKTPAPYGKETKCIKEPSKELNVDTIRRVGTVCEVHYIKQGFKEGSWEQFCPGGSNPPLIVGKVKYMYDKVYIRHDYYIHGKYKMYAEIKGHWIKDCKR